MNRFEFQTKEASMVELADLLRSPVLHAAIEIVRAEGIAQIPEPITGVDYSAQMAVAGAYSCGWIKAIKALESLAVPPTAAGRLPDLNTQFHHAAQRKMREAGIYTEAEISSITP